ncbi:hypothetical protein [Zhongshania sp.]|jgi:hypothetical protein|uniref:hypothetical protein n=1 Tax=Zhongshania sp. TaxID=1971902 RepID=UPI001B7B60A4|nr:hypothetical protein [Zhongshania sp.]MBQ0761363.1 hypothetical protein [Zhongshania sp.]MBQ0795780.1 hypothetical protein [Zhongshania sp.]
MAKNLDDTTTPLNGSAGGDCFEDAQRPQKPTPHGGNLDAGSAPPSNTAPSNCMDSLSGTTMLRVGIDSLYVSCKGQISEKTENLLRLSKELAQSADPDVRAGAFLEFGDHRFQVMDKGKRLFPYVLADNWFHLQVSGRDATSLPMVYCQIRSEVLACEGPKAVLMRLGSLLLEFSDDVAVLEVSRVDLCVDFVTSVDLGEIPDNYWVRRAASLNRYTKHDVFTGLMFGAGGDLSARLYDKTREIKEKSKKYFFYDLWASEGWDAESQVWRLEFQFRRPVLTELSIRSIGDLMDGLGSLWVYACGSWLQLCEPTNDKTRSRWPLHPLWSFLISADWGGVARSLWRVRTDRAPDDHYLFVHGLAGLSSFMAKEGISDVDKAMGRYIVEARRYHSGRTLTDRDALDRYLLEKARLKATKFNKPLPGIDGGEGDDF